MIREPTIERSRWSFHLTLAQIKEARICSLLSDRRGQRDLDLPRLSQDYPGAN